jgi:hypothetical protein
MDKIRVLMDILPAPMLPVTDVGIPCVDSLSTTIFLPPMQFTPSRAVGGGVMFLLGVVGISRYGEEAMVVKGRQAEI